MIRKIPPELAADVMGKKGNFVRIGLQRGLLPFGVAIPTSERGNKVRYSYYISPKKFMKYTGAKKSDIRRLAEEKGYLLEELFEDD